jgi:Leucine-rich repeat (LRR) protein
LFEQLSPALSSLDLSYNELSAVTLRALAELRLGESLRVLSLSGNMLSGEALSALLEELPALEQLSCADALLDPERACGLWSNARLMGLRRLDVSGGMIQTAELEALLDAAHEPSLTELKLARMALTDGDASALARAPALSKLEVLDISQNRISARGLELLLESAHLSSLTRLIAAGNPLEMTQAQELISRHARLEYNLQDARYALPDLGEEPWDEEQPWE